MKKNFSRRAFVQVITWAVCLFIFISCAGGPSTGGSSVRRGGGPIPITFAESPPVIDGVINPEEWGTPIFKNLSLTTPPPSDILDLWAVWINGEGLERATLTDVYFKWDNEYLYFAVDVKGCRPNAPYTSAAATASASDFGKYACFWIKACVGETDWAPQSQFYKLTNGTDVCVESGTVKSWNIFKIEFTDAANTANTRLVYEGAIPWTTGVVRGDYSAVEGDILRIAIHVRGSAGFDNTYGGSGFAVGTAMNYEWIRWISSSGSWRAVLTN